MPVRILDVIGRVCCVGKVVLVFKAGFSSSWIGNALQASSLGVLVRISVGCIETVIAYCTKCCGEKTRIALSVVVAPNVL